MIECQFQRCGEHKGRAICCCAVCGQKIYSDNPANCWAECGAADPTPCGYLGPETGEQVMVVCITCKKKRRERNYPIHQCSIFGECLPTYSCTPEALSESMSREIAVCRGCDHFQAKQPIMNK